MPQFSLKRMFASVTLICVGIGLWFAADRSRIPDRNFAFQTAAVLIGVGIGTIWRHPIVGGIVGYIAFVVWLLETLEFG
jgi:hypothetical protein